jgi:uncharacterized protein DUF4157
MAEERTLIRKPAVAERRPEVASRSIALAPTARPLPVMRTLQQRLGNHGTQAFAARVAARSVPGIASKSAAGVRTLSITQPGDAHHRKAENLADAVMLMAEPALGEMCDECQSHALQRKLAVGAGNDPLEMEADRIADEVLARPAVAAVTDVPSRIHRLTRQPSGQADKAPGSVDQALSSPGRPLEPALRQDMEQRFGYDFSRVRVHLGPAAEQSAQDVNASAYTVRHNIVFGARRFAPGSQEGRRLIAHELTHVVQQGAGVQLKDGLGLRGHDYEQHGDAVADMVQDRSAEPLDRFPPIVVAGPSSVGVVQREEVQSDEARVEACLLEQWRKYEEYEIKVLGMEDKLRAYGGWYATNAQLRAMSHCKSETNAEVPVIKAVEKRVAQGIEDKIVAKLVSNPGIGVKQWRRFVEQYDLYVEKYETLIRFRDRVESQLLGAYVDVKVAEAVKGSGHSASELKSLADLQIRQIIVNHRQDYFAAVSNGVNGWHAPRVPPDHWPSILSAGSSIAGGIGSIVSIGTGAVFASVAGPLLIAGIGFGIFSALKSIENADLAFRQQIIEDSIREETLHGFERKVEMIEATEDALAVVLAVEALKEGIDLKNIARAKLRAFCWEKMFAEFPEDQSKGRQEVQATMSSKLDLKLKGA